MMIALDYDDTYTRDPLLWDEFIRAARKRGHFVICATMRYDTPHEADEVRQALAGKVDDIVFTARRAKLPAVQERGYYPSVWIDDQPGWILNSAFPASSQVFPS